MIERSLSIKRNDCELHVFFIDNVFDTTKVMNEKTL